MANDSTQSADLKKCIGCAKELPRTEFWKGRGNSLQGRCKKCHVEFRKQYGFKRKPKERKPHGFKALEDETQKEIIELINGGELSKNKIAQKFNIHPQTFYYWCRKGTIH